MKSCLYIVLVKMMVIQTIHSYFLKSIKLRISPDIIHRDEKWFKLQRSLQIEQESIQTGIITNKIVTCKNGSRHQCIIFGE